MNLEDIRIEDYTYNLPPAQIASDPLAERDQSKLLVYDQGHITHSKFETITAFLPENSTLFFNDTKVIPARLLFQKESGSIIEIFLLNPSLRTMLLQQAMASTESVVWKCTIGNLKRWPDGMTLVKETPGLMLSADLMNRTEGLVRLSWSPAQLTFAEVLGSNGITPLPPYIHRPVAPEDKGRYQTIYSSADGAVAAPTAGLHFSEKVLAQLDARGIKKDFLTLHVSAGTFQPVKAGRVVDHSMHAEQMIVTRNNLASLLERDRKIVAVGTTSMRTLESLYWYGVKLLKDPDALFTINKMDPYYRQPLPTAEEAFRCVLRMMDQNGLDQLTGETSIFILPGYTFRVCEALITNFHQPGSTLMLLVAAFVGDDWKSIYEKALDEHYRFLSYGDSSLLLPKKVHGRIIF